MGGRGDSDGSRQIISFLDRTLQKLTECLENECPEDCRKLYNLYLKIMGQAQRASSHIDGMTETLNGYQTQFEALGVQDLVNNDYYNDSIMESAQNLVTEADEVFYGYGDEMENGANFVSGFADGISFGTSGWLAERWYGKGAWADENSGYYEGGYWTGVGASTIAIGWTGTNAAFATSRGFFWGGAGTSAATAARAANSVGARTLGQTVGGRAIGYLDYALQAVGVSGVTTYNYLWRPASWFFGWRDSAVQ